MAADGETIVRRWVDEVLTHGDLAAVDELFAPDFVNLSAPDQPRGPEGVREGVRLLHDAFSDLQVTIDDLFAHGDRVAWMFTCRGTHTGEFAGVAATNRPVEYQGLNMVRLADGRVAEARGVSDMLVIMQQLGVIAASPATTA